MASNYTWNSDDDHDATILRARTESNLAATESIGAPPGSTQAQCDAIIAAAAAENPPRIIGPVNIYGTNQQWVRDVIRDEVRRTKRVHKAADKAAYEATLAAATQEQKDQIAGILGLAPGTLAVKP